MPLPADLFIQIAQHLSNSEEWVEPGKMMSSPGICYKNKVFAFFYEDEMIFRLERDFEPEKHGIGNYRLLNPFKNKPAMKDWFHIPYEYSDQWEKLARKALVKMNKKMK